MKHLTFNTILVIIALLVVILVLISNEKSYTQEVVSFRDKANQLAGVLIFPQTPGPHPCIVLVHGDGAKARDDGGAYDVFFEEFTKAGWCVLSWDKPGMGKSTGDWLAQSMSDRADEVLAAIAYLQSRKDVIKNKIGLFGYSQAGWVLPLAASRSKKVAFIIPVSAAIDVVDQGIYYHRNQWVQKGLSEKQITERLAFYADVGKQMSSGSSYETYIKWHKKNAPEGYGDPESKRRWVFDEMLGHANARAALRKATCPVLAIWGSYDLRVDPKDSYAIYEEELIRAGNRNVTLRIFEGANHSLIAMSKKQFVHPGPASLWITAKYILLGKDAFAVGYFELLIEWLEARK